MSEFQHSLGFTAAILNRFSRKELRVYGLQIFVLQYSWKGQMWESRKKSSSLEYYQKPPFKGDPHECILEDPQIFIGDPNLFIWNYRIFIGDPNIFIWDPRFLLETPSYWSNRLQMFKPQTFCHTPLSVHWRPQTFSFWTPILFHGKHLDFQWRP